MPASACVETAAVGSIQAACDTAIRTVHTACHFARFTPDSDFFHHTFCTVHTVHSVHFSSFSVVANPLLNTILDPANKALLIAYLWLTKSLNTAMITQVGVNILGKLATHDIY